MPKDRKHPLSDAHFDRSRASDVPDTPQSRAPSYRLAYDDFDFLCRKNCARSGFSSN